MGASEIFLVFLVSAVNVANPLALGDKAIKAMDFVNNSSFLFFSSPFSLNILTCYTTNKTYQFTDINSKNWLTILTTRKELTTQLLYLRYSGMFKKIEKETIKKKLKYDNKNKTSARTNQREKRGNRDTHMYVPWSFVRKLCLQIDLWFAFALLSYRVFC